MGINSVIFSVQPNNTKNKNIFFFRFFELPILCSNFTREKTEVLLNFVVNMLSILMILNGTNTSRWTQNFLQVHWIWNPWNISIKSVLKFCLAECLKNENKQHFSSFWIHSNLFLYCLVTSCAVPASE